MASALSFLSQVVEFLRHIADFRSRRGLTSHSIIAACHKNFIPQNACIQEVVLHPIGEDECCTTEEFTEYEVVVFNPFTVLANKLDPRPIVPVDVLKAG